MKSRVALLTFALLSVGSLAGLVGGCGGASTRSSNVTMDANGVVHIGAKDNRNPH